MRRGIDVVKILDGKKLAQQLNKQTAQRVAALKDQGIIPGLAVVLVGNDPASLIYTRNKSRQADKLGFKSILKKLPADVTQQELLSVIHQLNADPAVHGILVQEPLPDQINQSKVIETIDPAKDVDGFNPINVGKLYADDGQHFPVACTPRGIMTMLEHYQIPVAGADVAIIGRSRLVGKPLQALMINQNATVTMLHHASADAEYYLRHADIVVVGIGKANYLHSQDIKKGAVVIDVGINRNAAGHLVGDVDYKDVSTVASAITPVPGGVGPMTIATLMQQTVDLTEWSN